MQATFRRLSDEDLRTFRPAYYFARWAGWKIFGAIILAGVLVQWITR